jgi:hypothetical protein
VYVPPTDSPTCGISWKTCTREKWDPDRPYDIVAKGCHTWPIHERAYVTLVRFIPLQGWLLIHISATLSDMSDSLFTAPLMELHVYYYVDGIRWLINDDEHNYITIMMYLPCTIDCYHACSSSG